MTINQIIENFKKNNPETETTMIQLAYDFAVKAHAGQRRKSGEPYIQHSLHTAFVLIQIKADMETIIAGLLHDIPEDTEFTLADIEKNFGKEIANLVEGITKLSKIKYRGIERYRESLRKMFLAMANDLRVILIKFADRLHNLRTLESLPLEKRQRIARETLEIYAPIANRLGIREIAGDLEDLAFKYVYPKEYQEVTKQVKDRYIKGKEYLQRIIPLVKKILAKKNIRVIEIHARAKHYYSLYRKLLRYDMDWHKI